MADILIRNIEMPRNAYGCEVIIRIQPNGEVLDLHGFHIGAHAIPVPPHGDLIDADALCKYCDNQIDHSVTPNDIMRMPTVIPADIDD